MKSWRDAPLVDEPPAAKPKNEKKKSWRDAPLADEAEAARGPAPPLPMRARDIVAKLPSFDISRPETYVGGAARAALEIPVGMERGLEDVGETILSPIFPRGEGTLAAAERERYSQQFGKAPVAQAGRFGGQVYGTSPVGGILGAGVQAVGRAVPATQAAMNALAQSLQTGGFRTGAAPTTAIGTAQNAFTRALGGGVSGGATTALTGEDATTGALVGAALPVAGIPAAKFLADKATSVIEAITGTLGKTRASNILRETLGSQYDQALTALRNASPLVTPEQALVNAGIDPTSVKAFMALGDWAAKRDPESIVIKFKDRQEQIRKTLLDVVSRGKTAEERLASQAAAGEKLRAATDKMREAELTGLSPIDPATITQKIDDMLAQAKIGVSDVNKRVLGKVGQKLKEWTTQAGDIDPVALYEIRKNYISEAIDEVLAGQTPSAKKKVAAGILSQVKPLIDDAIESAGGKGWRTYLKAYEEGAREIDRLRLAGEAAELYEKDAQNFVDLVRGRRPETVEDVFGPGKFKFEQQMAPSAAPGAPMPSDRRVPMRQVATEVEREAKISDAAKMGYDALQQILRNKEPGVIRIPNWFNPVVTASNRYLDNMEKKFGRQTVQTLIEAMQSGENAANALARVPAPIRKKVADWMQANISPDFISRSAALAAAQPNAMAEENQNAMRR